MSKDKKITYSEIFFSIQGEGRYTGIPTAWLRFWLCNLQCNGFGQKDPTDPSTYNLPYQDFDVSTIDKVEDLPVFDYGCDSSYTWAKKYKHLMHHKSPSDVADELINILKHPSNPDGHFLHPKSKQEIHLAFTGGEPMLNQPQIVDVMNQLYARGNFPNYVTVETNGTQKLNPGLKKLIESNFTFDCEWFWSVSPKIFATSGEPFNKAIKPEIVKEYHDLQVTQLNSVDGQLKFVCNGTNRSWDEIDHAVGLYREQGIYWDIWIMGVGATKESQETEQMANIATETIRRGYNFSGRLHAHIYGNELGT